jgi:Family of unknown function (DUF6527)
MKQENSLAHEFVEFIPDVLEEGKIYVSIEHSTVVHRCCCGCGKEVVTPLSPTDWKLIFDGKTISLDPSIGNWSFPCRSHYWIRNNRVRWAERWSQLQIDANRAHDRWAKGKYFSGVEESADLAIPTQQPKAAHAVPSRKDAWWKRLWPWQ